MDVVFVVAAVAVVVLVVMVAVVEGGGAEFVRAIAMRATSQHLWTTGVVADVSAIVK